MLLDVIPSQQPTADLEQKKVNAEHDESELNFERYAELIDQARQQLGFRKNSQMRNALAK
ncbi:hypothetical protein BATDEDRAFT_87869 [Batrachochytrium dendrobatidis JAM81]|uniref:Suppressor of white apricot N-terminal domain-containing protein n=1 Tax=Batrachochytrium dendrobatidis (strain JAM81 / FGSC 10211) TaxID=684364 RepID=F4NZD9_BATDJ|nr:uncharacterized protein BATDEDRAFT_87869 [Batrachochytrium dendrobatidis JAM81]EGF81253.1 hypothetical protein BATDEDRAFT_87869 [Batrachochytrium dendrobatidis JAM81]|eukprot:XP_006678138.1 hypothetical protein BATDEDRAFT_87869 [Batrachochytrium dendrobatidis JAM81]